jgi:predicted exporter
MASKLAASLDLGFGAVRRETRCVPDIFDLNTLFAQMVLALGAALLLGNGYALFMDRKGVRPKGREEETLRGGRAWFLVAIGAVMTWWGLGSLIVN